MRPRRFTFVQRCLAISLACLTLGAASTLFAQQPPQLVEVPPNSGLHEQTIYIPYSKLRETFEKQGRGVFLPYEKFQELWKAARDKQGRPLPEKLPVRALITEVFSEAVFAEQVVNVTATLKIDLLAEGWHKIPLRLGNAAIRAAQIGGEPARLVVSADGTGYTLLVKKEGQQPEQIELTLQYARSFTKTPGQNSVSFSPPLAPVSRWKIRIPESGVRVDVEPMLATTEVPAVEGRKETVVLAFVGAAPSVCVAWTPKSEGAAGLEALGSVQTLQEMLIDEGVMRTRAQLAYEISRAELSQLVVEVPSDQKVTGVFDPNIRQWKVTVDGAVQRITADLFQPAKQHQKVTVELETFIPEADQQQLIVPVIQALAVARQQGIVVVQIAAGLQAEVTSRQGLVQSDVAEMPAQLTGKSWTLAYRYAATPYQLELSVEKVKPEIQVTELVETYLEPEKISVDFYARYEIERAGLYEMQFDVPAGYEVRGVEGHAIDSQTEDAAVDAYHLEGQEKTRLRVNLSHKARGRVGLVLRLEKRIDDQNLHSPTGKISNLSLPLPRVAPGIAKRSTGRVIVYGPESLRLSPGKLSGLRMVSIEEAASEMASAREGRISGLRPVLAYAFGQERAELALSAERRKPHITVRQLLVARVDAGVVKYDSTLTYNILYSGVSSLRIDVPVELAGLMHNATPSIREKIFDPPPPDLAEGYVAWSLTGQSELLGEVVVSLSWEQSLEKIDVGKSLALEFPVLKPREVTRSWGQLVVVKAETLDVSPVGKPQGLRPIDPQDDLMQGARVPDAALALEFQEDWKLTIAATRYQLEAIKHTSIERALLRMVVTRSDQISVQALYRVRSARQRLAVKLPEGVQFDTEPLRINGRAVSLERGEKDEFYVPLGGYGPNEPVALELRYTTSGGAGRLDYPWFPDEPAVQKVYLVAFLPEELTLLGWRGPWNDEPRRSAPYLPAASDEGLVDWVTAGITAGNLKGEFQTDGRSHLFSTLRPESPETGALCLTVMSERRLHVLVFLGVAVVGLTLVGRPISQRLLALAGFAALLILLGVFLPTFSRQIFDGVLFAALLLVLVIWFGVYVLRERPVQFDELVGESSEAQQSHFESEQAKGELPRE